MFEAVLVTVGLFLCVLGLSEVLHSIWLTIIRPKKSGKTLVLTLLDEQCATEQLNVAIDKSRWYGRAYGDFIIAVGRNLSEQTTDKCLRIANFNHNVIYCDFDEISQTINGLYEEDNDTGKPRTPNP